MYGIGPLAFLAGEITLVDGRSFVSRVVGDSAIVVEERRDVQAPFFVRAEARSWTMVPISIDVVDLRSLDAFLTQWAKDRKHPFLFRLRGLVGQEIGFHVMNVPPGTSIRSPDEAHAHQVKYMDRGNEGTLIGFFSTQHHGIFVHHDANIHVHYLSWDHTRMGHVDQLMIDPTRVVLEIAE
jgi:acetolactate decarboxylase